MTIESSFFSEEVSPVVLLSFVVSTIKKALPPPLVKPSCGLESAETLVVDGTFGDKVVVGIPFPKVMGNSVSNGTWKPPFSVDLEGFDLFLQLIDAPLRFLDILLSSHGSLTPV